MFAHKLKKKKNIFEVSLERDEQYRHAHTNYQCLMSGFVSRTWKVLCNSIFLNKKL